MLFAGRSLFQVLHGEGGELRPDIAELRGRVFRVIGEELSGQDFKDASIPTGIMPHIKGAVENLKWPNQSKPVTELLLALLERVAQQVSRQLRDTEAPIGG
jgi:hypothetical protein